MKAVLPLLLAFLLLPLTVVSGCSPRQETEPIRVGLLVPLTGGAASYGQNARMGAELALQHFRAEHPDISVELIVEDSRGEPAPGTRAVQKLLDLDEVVAVVGCVTSGVTMAVAPTMNERQVPLVSPGASSPNISSAGEYVFRTWPSDDFEAARMADHLQAQDITELAILKVNNEYGLAMENALRSRLDSLGGVEVILSESFEQGAQEVRSQLLRIKQSPADALYFVGFPEAAVVFGRGYSDVGLSLPVFSTSAFEDPQVPQNTAGVLDNTVYTKPISETPATSAFRSTYQGAYNEEPGLVSDTAYDAMMLILEAISNARQSSQEVSGRAIHDYLLAIRDYAGVSGTLSFDPNGDVIKPVGLFVLRNGAYQELQTSP